VIHKNILDYFKHVCKKIFWLNPLWIILVLAMEWVHIFNMKNMKKL